MVRIDSPEVQEFEKEHLATLRSLAPECMVLLKKNGDFPLSAPCKVALYGAGARETIKGGTGSGDVNVRHYVSLEEGLENAGFTVTTKAWMDGYKAIRDGSIKGFYEGIAQEAKELGKSVFLVGMGRTPPEPRYALPLDGKGEVCVYVLARNSGEGADRPGNEGDYLLTEDEKRGILRCAEQYKKFLVVLHNGSPVEMPWIGKVRAVLEAYLGGQAVGEAEIRVLTGDVNPSGHLPESFPKQLEDNPSFLYYGGEGNRTEYREGVFVGYRYYDKKKMDVLFPFGHGLSYTTFAFSNLRLSAEKIRDTETLTVTVTVTNTGKRAGKAVAQLYVGDPESTVLRPVRELKGFRKVALQGGESKDVSFTLDKRSFAYWNTEIHDWHVESGEFILSVGDSSRNLPLSASVQVESTVELPRHYTPDSIYLDVMADPKARAIMEDFMQKSMEVFGHEDESAGTEAAKEAISEDMVLAMMKYMPLRGILSFGGADSAGELERLLEQLNRL